MENFHLFFCFCFKTRSRSLGRDWSFRKGKSNAPPRGVLPPTVSHVASLRGGLKTSSVCFCGPGSAKTPGGGPVVRLCSAAGRAVSGAATPFCRCRGRQPQTAPRTHCWRLYRWPLSSGSPEPARTWRQGPPSPARTSSGRWAFARTAAFPMTQRLQAPLLWISPRT